MNEAIMCISTIALSVFVDRLIWRKIFVYLSFGPSSGEWELAEKKAKYNYFNPIKWGIYIAITLLMLLSKRQIISDVSGKLLVVIVLIFYGFYAFKIARKDFCQQN